MTDLSSLAGNTPLDLKQLRARLGRMTEAELLRFGKAARYMCSPRANRGRPPRQEFVIQLQEARAEWRRRRVRDKANFGVSEAAIRAEDGQ